MAFFKTLILFILLEICYYKTQTDKQLIGGNYGKLQQKNER